MVTIHQDSATSRWLFKAEGETLPNCLLKSAGGSRSFPGAWLALLWAKDNGVTITNTGEYA